MSFLPIGTVQTAYVLRKIDTGYVLKKETDEVLLHHNEAEHELEVDDVVNVFLYLDKNNETVASMKIPHVTLDTYDWAEVVDVVFGLGVFVDIGTTKDMLISLDDLPIYEAVWPKQGDQLYVTLGFDQQGRLLAIPATEGIFMQMRQSALDNNVAINDTIQGRVYYTSREGAALFSEASYRGFIHHTEREKEPRLGELIEGRVIHVKEDGTLNLSLLPLKEERLDKDAEAILAYLKSHDGVMPFGDKSDAEDIRVTFQISKSAFKRALGRLMKQRRVEQKDGQTYLVK